MKANLKFAVSFCCLLGTSMYSALAQGFVNLDFEAANVSGYSAGPVPTEDAIPGWTAYIGTTVQSDINYNTLSLGAPSVAIFSTTATPPALDGAYSVDLYGGVAEGGPAGVSISQTGLVPSDAASISFIAQASGGATTLLVSLGGQNIAFSALSTGANYTLYGGSIPSGLADQNEQLTFSAPPGENNYWEIDDIQFSAFSVPEPSSFVMLAFGGLLLGLQARRRGLP